MSHADKPHPAARLVALGLCLTPFTITALEAQEAGSRQGARTLGVNQLGDIIAGSHGITVHQGRPVAGGDRYRATFEEDGFTFTPALGRDAEESGAVSFQLEEIRIGSAPYIRDVAPAKPRHEGDSVSYLREHGVVERYEVLAEGVHQTFLFPERPPGQGDLVVRGRIVSAIGGVPSGDGAAFLAEGLGGVTWGGVTGIDADGRTVTGEVRVGAGTLELVLPGSFVAEASYPLLLDPIVGAVVTVDSTAYDDVLPDVAYDATNGVYLIVWNRWFTIDDRAIRGRRYDQTGAPVGTLIQITAPPEGIRRATSDPAVASINASNRFLVTWTESTESIIGKIKAAAIDADDGGVSAPIFVDIDGTEFQMRSDVGGERTLDFQNGLVAWRADGLGIRMRRVFVPAHGDPFVNGAPITLELDFGTIEQQRVAISKSGGDSGHYLVAWGRNDTAGTSTILGTGSIRAQIVTRDLVPLGGDVNVSGANLTLDNRLPDVDGDGERWVIAWERREVFVDNRFDVMTRAVERNGSALEFPFLPNYLESDANDHEGWCAVAWTGNGAMLAYCDESGPGYEAYVTSIDPYTGEKCEPEDYVPAALGYVQYAAAASEWSGGGAGVLKVSDNALVALNYNPDGWSDHDVIALRYDAPPLPMNLGGATANGGVNLNPCAFAGNTNFRAQLRGGLPGAPTFFVVSWTDNPIGCASGTWYPLLAPGHIVVPRLTDADGNASAQGSIPVTMAGVDYVSQWLTPSAGGGCTYGSGFEFSNGLRVTVQ